ncbi:MAG: RnfABCDGE type electron transport complex subunit D [Lachnospiraceae bacterium]|nr:RnfABCDGE type electron transport complex subunit D [Lachnospiraceae bacterium]
MLISFSTALTNFSVDGVSSATPLEALRAGDTINVAKLYLGTTNGVIGGSALALLSGGMYLWAAGGITLEIPVSCIVAFTAFMGLFGEGGFAPAYLIAQICGGGLLMGAFFMATDPVTSPVTSRGQIIYGAIIGIIGGLFRVYGSSADSFSYAIIITNMLVPFIDKIPIPKPLGYKSGEYREREFPKSAVNLTVITLVAGLILSGVYAMTKTKIEEQEMAASLASYQEVLPDAVSFGYDDDLDDAIEALGEDVYDEAFGRTYVNTAVVGYDASGNIVGYVLSVTSSDGFDGDITLSVGLTTDGTVTKLSFTTLTETAGMGMRVDEDAFKSQFEGVKTDAFVLNKSGSSTAENEIDTVSGASTSSGAVVNAVNTALAFFAEYIA